MFIADQSVPSNDQTKRGVKKNSPEACAATSLATLDKSLGNRNHHATEIYSRLGIDPVWRSVECATLAVPEAGGIRTVATLTKFSKEAA